MEKFINFLNFSIKSIYNDIAMLQTCPFVLNTDSYPVLSNLKWYYMFF